MKEIRTQLRMPEGTHKWVTERARNNGRSMNAEINQIIKAEQAKEEAEEKRAA